MATLQRTHELLSCPFCGSAAYVTEMDGAWIAGCDAGQKHADDDMRCRANAIGFYHRTRDGAVAAWNRRALKVTREDVDRAVATYLAVPHDRSWHSAMRDVLDEFVAHKRTADLFFNTLKDEGQRIVAGRCVECGALGVDDPDAVAKVETFNRTYSIGSAFDYASYTKAAPKRVTTRSKAYVLAGHTAVVMVEGVSSCVAIGSLTPVVAAECEDDRPVAGFRDANDQPELQAAIRGRTSIHQEASDGR